MRPYFKNKNQILDMKKITKILVVIVLAVASVTNVNSQDVINRIKESGELRVGTSANQPPYTLKTRDNQIIGYEMDLAKLLAESMGVEVKIVEMPFGALLNALTAGKIDVIMSGMTINMERNMRAAFVGPYMISGKSILTKSANLEKLDENAEIDNEAVTLVALKGSTSEKFVQKYLPKAKLIAAKDYDEAVKLVMEDKAAAMVSDAEIIAVTMMRYPNSDLTALSEPLTIEPIGMALPTNDFLFINLVENYLAKLALTGYLEQIQANWFDNGNWLLNMK